MRYGMLEPVLQPRIAESGGGVQELQRQWRNRTGIPSCLQKKSPRVSLDCTKATNLSGDKVLAFETQETPKTSDQYVYDTFYGYR